MSEHPRERFDLIPDRAAEAAFEAARDRGRLHHAWLLCGVEGTGKATFAYRAARNRTRPGDRSARGHPIRSASWFRPSHIRT